MRPGMAVCLTSKICHPLYGRRIGRNTVSHHKERLFRRLPLKSPESVVNFDGPSSNVSATIGLVGSTLLSFGPSGTAAPFPVTVTQRPSTESLSSVPAVSPFFHRSCPGTILVYRIINVIIFRKLSGKGHSDRLKRGMSVSVLPFDVIFSCQESQPVPLKFT